MLIEKVIISVHYPLSIEIKIMKRFLFLICILCGISAAQARDRQCFDKDWRFFLGDSIAMAKADFDDSQWQQPERSALPIGKMRGNTTPPMVVQEVLYPRDIRLTEDGRILFDFGQNFAGWMRVPIGQMGLNKGDTLRLRFAEKLEAPIGAPWTEQESWNSNGPGYCLTDTSRLYVENLRNAAPVRDNAFLSPGECIG